METVTLFREKTYFRFQFLVFFFLDEFVLKISEEPWQIEIVS